MRLDIQKITELLWTQLTENSLAVNYCHNFHSSYHSSPKSKYEKESSVTEKCDAIFNTYHHDKMVIWGILKERWLSSNIIVQKRYGPISSWSPILRRNHRIISKAFTLAIPWYYEATFIKLLGVQLRGKWWTYWYFMERKSFRILSVST